MLTARNFPGEPFPALFHVDRASPDPEFGLQESPDRQRLFLVLLRKFDHVELPRLSVSKQARSTVPASTTG